MPDNIYPDKSNDKFDIQYAPLLGLSSDIRASFGLAEDGGSPVIKTPDDNSTGHLRFGVAAEDAVAIQNRSFDLNGAYSFQLTQLGNKQFLVDPPNGLYQLGAIPVPGSDSGLSYTYLEIDDTTSKITLQAPEGIVLPGYGYGNHSGTYTKFLAVDAGGNMIEVDAAGGGSVTADNGLTMSTATNVQLGSTSAPGSDLLHDSYIDANGFTLFMADGAGTSPQILYVSGGTTTAIQASGVQGITSYGSSVGIGGTSPGLPLWAIGANSSASAVQQVILVDRNPFGSVSNGIGASIDFQISTTSTADYANKIISKWTDATHATRTSQLDITGVNSAVTATIFSLMGSGQLQLPKYGVGAFTGTDAYWLAVDSSGNIIEMGAPAGGSDTNFAEDDLTFTGGRTHDLNGNYLWIVEGNTSLYMDATNFGVYEEADGTHSAYFEVNSSNSSNSNNHVVAIATYGAEVNQVSINSTRTTFSRPIGFTSTFTPANSTDGTYDNGTLIPDDTYLWFRDNSGTWKKIAWTAF